MDGQLIFSPGEQSYPLGAYAVAMAVDVAQLETMTWVSI